MDVIMIPGFWLDGSSWAQVLPALEHAGHHPRPLTLPGMQSPGADRSGVTLRDHVAAVVAEIDALDPADGPVALVGHSGGGALAHAAVDARPDRVAHVVYVDSGPLGEGEAINDRLPVVAGEIPLPDWEEFEDGDLLDLDDQQRARFRARAVPTPARVATDPQRLSDPRRYDVPVTVVACEFPSETLRGWLAEGHPYVRELGLIRDVSYVDLPTGHWPQFTRPAELGEVIAGALS